MKTKEYRVVELDKVFLVVNSKLFVFAEFDYMTYNQFNAYTYRECYKNACKIAKFLNDEE